MKNIVLVGFMGTGKTTVGKNLAQLAGMKYISTDDIIVEREAMPIADIFSKKGEMYFRCLEKDVIREISNMDNVVIDTGGGVVTNPENVKNLKEKGVLVCLWSSPEDVYARTKKYTNRPLLNVEDPLKKIKELLEKRKPYYEQADYHINTSEVSIDEAVKAVLGFVGKSSE